MFTDNMKLLLKNPLSIWLIITVRNLILYYKNQNKYLKIGYMSRVSSCTFGQYNTLYENVCLHDSSLGDFTYIASGTQISRTTIGKFCSIGPDCKIGLGKHPSKDFVSTHPIFFSTFKQTQITFSDKDYFVEFEDISIGNDVWIGANVVVMGGVKIENGAIVAAGSVVTKDIPSYAIVGGVPAKIIRYRFEKNEIEKLLKLNWWDMDVDYLKRNFRKFHGIASLDFNNA